MVQKLEAIKGGGGSIRVGTVGTIGSLMTRELQASNSGSLGALKPRISIDEASSSQVHSCIKHKNPEVGGRVRGQTQHRILVINSTTPKRQKPKAPLDDLGNSPLRKGIVKMSSDLSGKTYSHKRSSHIPMLGSENIHLEKTPVRDRQARNRSSLAHVVDIHCGNSTGALSNRLKKLSFSKLSQSFI